MFATTYDGPVDTTPLTIAGRSIRLVRPAEPERLLDDAAVLELNRCDDYMPYWAYLWPSAFLLAEAVGREPWPSGAAALEIGCGIGLAGLVGMAAGLRVRFTDYDATPLEFVTQSVHASGLDPAMHSTARLDWRHITDERYAIILGADVLYERRLVPLVVKLIDRMLEPGGVALVAGPYRVATEDLGETLRRHGLVDVAEPIASYDESGRPVRGTLHRIRRPG